MDLQVKKQELEKAYQDLANRKEVLIGEVKEIETEQLRLQGEARLLAKFEEEAKQADIQAKVNPQK